MLAILSGSAHIAHDVRKNVRAAHRHGPSANEDRVFATQGQSADHVQFVAQRVDDVTEPFAELSVGCSRLEEPRHQDDVGSADAFPRNNVAP